MSDLTAVEKAVALLRTVDRHSASGLGVSDLARRTGIAKSTVFRLVRTLEGVGALERVGERYRLRSLLGESLGIPDSSEVERVQVSVTPFLAALYERSRQTVQLAVLDGLQVCFLNKLHGLHRVPSPSRIGGRVPAHCTSLGKALLAFTPGSAERAAEAELVGWTPATITDHERLYAELATVRRTRLGIDVEETVRGVASVASVVVNADGRAVASLCVTGPRAEIVGPGFEPLVLEVCARASRAYQKPDLAS